MNGCERNKVSFHWSMRIPCHRSLAMGGISLRLLGGGELSPALVLGGSGDSSFGLEESLPWGALTGGDWSCRP